MAILIGVKKSWIRGYDMVKTAMLSDGIAHTWLSADGTMLNIFTIYNKGLVNDLETTLKNITERHEREGIIIGGDFNIRMGSLEGTDWRIVMWKGKARTK